MQESNESFRRLYANSYTMKSGGHDCDFVLDLGQSYQYQSLQIDQVVIENKFCPFYPSQKKDFRIADFEVTIGGLVISIPLICD